MELQDFADISKIIIALFSVVGFIASIYFSRKSLDEIRKDRVHSQRPYLVFEGGGYGSYIEFRQIEGEPNSRIYPYSGDKPGYVLDYKIGKLKNYGPGTAFEINVNWKADKVWNGKEQLDISTLSKNEKSLFSFNNNNFVTNHTNLGKNEITWLLHFPWFITQDFDRKISRVDGKLIINYLDSHNNKQNTIQIFRIFTEYESKKLTVTFAEVIKPPKNE